MPSTRRQSAGVAASKSKAKPKAASQTKLAFHGQNRVTKAAPADLGGKKKLDIDDETEVTSPNVATVELEDPASADSSLVEVSVPEIQTLDAAEQRAAKVKDAQIKKYWADKEKERKAPRVHQEGLSLHEKLLREWDTEGRYGPCIGSTRMKRWKRADMLGLNPPIEVLAALMKEAEAENKKAQRPHLEELLSSRYAEEE